MNNEKLSTYFLIFLTFLILVIGGFCFFWFIIHTLIGMLEFEVEHPKTFSFLITLLFSSLAGIVSRS